MKSREFVVSETPARVRFGLLTCLPLDRKKGYLRGGELTHWSEWPKNPSAYISRIAFRLPGAMQAGHGSSSACENREY